MNTYLITFDLVAPGRNYQPVYDYMATFADSMKPLQTVYLVSTSKTAATIRTELKTHIDENDKILVVQHSGGWATSNLPKTTVWLQNH